MSVNDHWKIWLLISMFGLVGAVVNGGILNLVFFSGYYYLALKLFNAE